MHLIHKEVDHRTSGQIDALDAHASQVVQGLYEPVYVTSVPNLNTTVHILRSLCLL